MKLGLIGNNISYSLSPFIHTFLLEQMEINGSYELIDLSEDAFNQVTITDLAHYDGLNITIPYKTSILEKLNTALFSKEVIAINATNCLNIKNDTITCYNTDGYGFIKPLSKRPNFSPKQILLLGTGGAMKAIEASLIATYPQAKIQIISRRPTAGQLSYNDLTVINTAKFDLIVNTTPVCPHHFTKLKDDVILYDLNYRDDKCIFLHSHPNKQHINGIAMLVYQAVKSFEIWNDCIVSSEIIERLFTEIEVHYGIKQ